MSIAAEPVSVPPRFDGDFRRRLEDLYRWRRDVRRFRTEPLEPALVDRLLALAVLAPSVGNSQPWRFVKVDDPLRRQGVREAFARANAAALATFHGDRAALYARLKLSGLDRAPVQLAAFVDDATGAGHGLGRQTMPETLAYSVVGAVHALWLAARAHGVGVGWVSILDPDAVHRILEVPDSWRLIAYLCVGYPEEEHLDPELERHGWQARLAGSGWLLQR
ncbi:MAG: 5,6-dimethylbenzimidazole synthase [Rhodospirillales bacterium]|nr:5,6-dimethylbenzimidazole synthase [Rhodospirillales bacterium]